MRLIVGIILCSSVLIGFTSCNYSGLGVGGSPECRASCLKKAQCCEADQYCDPWDEYRMQECLCPCGNIHRTATDEFLRGMKECEDLPCESEAEREMCKNSLLAGCSSGLTPAVEAFCTRADDCSVDDEFDECVQMFSSMMGCYSPNLHDAMLTCSSVGSCETFHDEFEICFDGKLGIDDCIPVDY